MAFGIKVLGPDGTTVFLDTSSIAFNQVDSFLAAAGATIVKTYAGMGSYTFSAYKTPAAQLPITVVPTPHTITISANTVTVGGGTIDEYIVVLAK